MGNMAAGFICRAAFVGANALLKDECGVEYRGPSQAWYYALFRGHGGSKAINGALKHVAGVLGCMTCIGYQGSSSGLMVVGEGMGGRRVWRAALKTYMVTLNEWVSRASIKSWDEWLDDCILGFFEGLTGWRSYAHPGFLDWLMV